MSFRKEEKLKEIYVRISRQNRRSIIYFFSGMGLLILAVAIEQLLLPVYSGIVSFGGILMFVILLFMAINLRPSFEKRVFLRIFKMYQDFAGYLKISDTSTLKKKNLDFVISSLHNLSSKLRRKPLEGKSDLIAESNQKYARISEYVRTKIIAYLQRNKDLEIVKIRILRLASVFSDATMEKIDKYLEDLKDIPDEEFQAIPSRFDRIKTLISSNPALRIGGEFLVCLIFVGVVAYFLFMVLSAPLADFAGHILVASFALLAAWEARRR